jgi:PAS domain S-box-containing protein
MDAERALRESEQRYRSVVTSMAEGVVLQDASSTILACNASAERLLGLSVAQMMGRSSLDPRWRAIHEDGSAFPGDTHPASVTLRTGEPLRDVVMGVHKPDDTLTWITINTQPLFHEGDAEPYAVVSTFGDITRRKLAEDALRESEALHRRILDTTLEGVWIVDLAGTTRFANRRMAEMLGCTLVELEASTVFDFVDEADRELVTARLAARAKGYSAVHGFRFRRHDGGYTYTNLVATLIVHTDGTAGALAFVRDVTESRRMEAELRDSEAWLNLALSAGGMATVEWNVTTGRISHSSQLAAIFGLPPDVEIRDRDALFERVHPDDRARLDATIHELVESGSGGRFFDEYRIVRLDGQVRLIQSSGRALREPSSGTVRILGALSDITERRALELQLQQSSKLESIGRLAGGVAHDFNNLLTVILSSVSLAKRPSANVAEGLEMIREAAERAAGLSRQLLAFARRQVVKLAPIDVNVVVRRLEVMLRRLLGEDVELACRLGEGLWMVRSDATQLEQVILNLAINAREAMPDGGPVTIATRNTVLDVAYASSHADVVPGEYVALAVTDAGMGIDESTLQHIFEPFFTTKSLGTGLGLASSYGIVNQLGGHIQVQSAPGQGTTFTVYLPREPASVAEAPPAGPAPTRLASAKTILLVEDDELLRKVVVRGLRDLGFDVLGACHGEQALALAERHVGRIDAVVTDVVMPKMSGGALAERLQKLRPETRILFVSGYTDDRIAHQGVLEPSRNFLPKPYTVDALAGRLSELLSA